MTENTNAASPLIVVGVDGSDGSCEALRWAVAEAVIRGSTVRAVYSWGFPYVVGPEGTAFYLDPIDLTRDAELALEETLERAVPDDAARAAIERLVVDGNGAQALIDQSKTAHMVVVGARGHGGFVGLLLGSVSTQVVHHAECPVVVVRKRLDSPPRGR